MKILAVHNYYQQPGGEDEVFEAETKLLREQGHEVVHYIDSNSRIDNMNYVSTAINTLWSSDTKGKIAEMIDATKPDIAHFHNTFLLTSPSAYYACKEAQVPVVQSLHNPRLLCPSANLYRNGSVCEDCVGKTFPMPGVVHGCYRNSRSQTAVVAAMLTLHRWLKTWQDKVDKYIVFTEFYKNKFIEGGLPSKKIALKPHFISPDPECRKTGPGEYALFIGRLDKEKGIKTLMEAWRNLSDVPLKIRGGGDLQGYVEDFKEKNSLGNIEIVGRLSSKELFDLIKNARFLVWPSEGYYETFGLVAIEAYACGVPVIASRIGTLAENVKDGYSGLHFTPGDDKDFSSKVRWAWDNPEKMIEMGKNARNEYELKYTPEKNYRMLLEIYERTIEESKSVNNKH